MNKKTRNTAHSVRQELLRKIKEGYFGRGTAMPPERTLAEESGVSYMTARKAISDLVEAGYLERRHGIGTFVRSDLEVDKASLVVGIVMPAWSSAEIVDFVAYASEYVSQHHWLSRTIMVVGWNDRAFEDAINTCDAIICSALESLEKFPEKLRQRIKQRKLPFVLIGNNGREYGFDSVCCNDPRPLEMALQRLRQAGHREIAFAIQSTHEVGAPNMVHKNYWMAQLNLEGDPQRLSQLLLEVDMPQFGLPQQQFYELVQRRYRENHGKLPFTAIIASLPFSWSIAAALEDLNLRVPEDVSLMLIGERQEVGFYRPQPSRVETNMRGHIAEACAILERRLAGAISTSTTCNRFIEPEFFAGDTIKNVTNAGRASKGRGKAGSVLKERAKP